MVPRTILWGDARTLKARAKDRDGNKTEEKDMEARTGQKDVVERKVVVRVAVKGKASGAWGRLNSLGEWEPWTEDAAARDEYGEEWIRPLGCVKEVVEKKVTEPIKFQGRWEVLMEEDEVVVDFGYSLIINNEEFVFTESELQYMIDQVKNFKAGEK